MSQLLCEQVVGRGLRRASYEPGVDGRMGEEVAKVLGVPFEVVPFKANPGTGQAKREQRFHIHPVPDRAELEILFPRVDGYDPRILRRVTVDWDSVPSLTLDPTRIPPEVEMKGLSVTNQGRLSLTGPGRAELVTLEAHRARLRMGSVHFMIATELTRGYLSQPGCDVPAQALFPQVLRIVQRYVAEKVRPIGSADRRDVALSPYYGWVIETLLEAIRPDTEAGEEFELPRYERSRGQGSTSEVSFWTSREPREILRSHLNYVVPDTKTWEQSAAFILDTSAHVRSFAKNAGLAWKIHE